jgi:hypothetical protein
LSIGDSMYFDESASRVSSLLVAGPSSSYKSCQTPTPAHDLSSPNRPSSTSVPYKLDNPLSRPRSDLVSCSFSLRTPLATPTNLHPPSKWPQRKLPRLLSQRPPALLLLMPPTKVSCPNAPPLHGHSGASLFLGSPGTDVCFSLQI